MPENKPSISYIKQQILNRRWHVIHKLHGKNVLFFIHSLVPDKKFTSFCFFSLFRTGAFVSHINVPDVLLRSEDDDTKGDKATGMTYCMGLFNNLGQRKSGRCSPE
jgi:hypothetical protein